MPEEKPEISQVYWLGPIKSFFLYNILSSSLFWIGVALMIIFTNDGAVAGLYTWLSGTPAAGYFQTFYEWGASRGVAIVGMILILFSIVRSYVTLKVTRFVIEEGILIVSRGKFSMNPLSCFQRNDYTVALNLIYDVDVKKTIFQYIFGGGDVYVRTASNDIFHLQFVEDPHKVREYFLEHSGIKNKPVIGVY
jgi:uncharacterized membrane protein YdbT with pleckstrin-like domain